MKSEKNKTATDNTSGKKSKGVQQSSADMKNESIKKDTPSASERVKPRAGDGLANEGTNVSYEGER